MPKRGWGSPNSDEGTYTVVLCKYKYFVVRELADRKRANISLFGPVCAMCINWKWEGDEGILIMTTYSYFKKPPKSE